MHLSAGAGSVAAASLMRLLHSNERGRIGVVMTTWLVLPAALFSSLSCGVLAGSEKGNPCYIYCHFKTQNIPMIFYTDGKENEKKKKKKS